MEMSRVRSSTPPGCFPRPRTLPCSNSSTCVCERGVVISPHLEGKKPVFHQPSDSEGKHSCFAFTVSDFPDQWYLKWMHCKPLRRSGVPMNRHRGGTSISDILQGGGTVSSHWSRKASVSRRSQPGERGRGAAWGVGVESCWQ